VIIAVVLVAGCDLLPAPTQQSSAPPVQTTAPATQVQWSFYVVRHAERADDGSEDPPLTAEGEQRAQRLAQLLGNARGVAVYATQFQRTQSTAQPTAQAWGVSITTYDGQSDAAGLIQSIKGAHPQGTILIVGHSDTVPDIVSKLCDCQVDPIDDSDFGNLFHVDIGSDGSVLKAEQNPSY
jgi:broad specificity phosphatase PhoE